jgi:ParB-like chromosome segregation protein Spo0J
MNEAVVQRYLEDIKEGIQFPPIKVQKDTFILIDGLHRLNAMKAAGMLNVPVEEVECDDIELALEAYKSNSLHGLMLSTEDRHLACKKMLKWLQSHGMTKELALDAISAATGYSRSYIEKITRESDDPRAKRIPAETRQRIVEEVKSGKSLRSVAREFGVTHDAVADIVASADEAEEESEESVGLLAIPDKISGIATPYEEEEDDRLSSIDEEACSPGEQDEEDELLPDESQAEGEAEEEEEDLDEFIARVSKHVNALESIYYSDNFDKYLTWLSSITDKNKAQALRDKASVLESFARCMLEALS